MKMVKKILSVLLCFMLFVITPIISNAEEVEGDPGTQNRSVEMTKDLNDTGAAAKYDKDATISVFLYVEPAKTWSKAGDFGCTLNFYPTEGGKDYWAAIKTEKVYNATHYEDNFVKDYYYLPSGKWTFTVSAAQNFPTEDVKTYCYQNEINTEKGKVYELYALMGSTEWVEKNKVELIPSEYRNMGNVLKDNENINSEEANNSIESYLDEYNLVNSEYAADLDVFNKSIKKDSKVRIYQDLDKPVYISGKYYDTWLNKMEWGDAGDKNDFKEQFKKIAKAKIKKSKDDSPICLDDEFKQFCNDKNIDLKTDTKVKADVKPESKEKGFPPVVGFLVLLGTIVVLGVGIKNKLNK